MYDLKVNSFGLNLKMALIQIRFVSSFYSPEEYLQIFRMVDCVVWYGQIKIHVNTYNVIMYDFWILKMFVIQLILS